MFWGLSPALDLQEEYIKQKAIELEEINILIIGGCDARHILKTLAQSYRHHKAKINIHVIEGCSELVARQLTLLSIALAQPKTLGLQEKTRYFMEIYGNTLLRSTSSKALISLSKHLTKMITNLEYMEKMMPLIKFERMKYRERDYIEMLLKFWGASNSKFDICNLWDNRIRKSLGMRYDSRFGVFDWDYNMRLRDIGGKTVNSQEFKHFRSTGVAFTWLETEVSRPNHTLAAGVLTTGDGFIHRGYLGDIVTGPYIAYGLDCEDQYMMESSNGTHLKRATDITERNIMRMLYELQSAEPFDPKTVKGDDSDHNLGLVTMAMIDAKLSEQSDFEFSNIKDNHLPSISVDFANVFFHSSSALELYPDKLEYQKKFQIIFVGYNLRKKVQPSLMKLIEDGGLVLVEGCKFILDMNKNDIKAFEKEIDKISYDCGCDLASKFEPLKDPFATLIVKQRAAQETI